MKNNKKFYILFWGFTILPTLVICLVFNFLPDRIPAHYDISGAIDRWGSKYEAFILPVTVILLSFLWLLFIKSCEKKVRQSTEEKELKEAENNLKVMRIMLLGVVLFFNVMNGVMLYNTWRQADFSTVSMSIDAGCIIMGAMGVLFLVIGNVMPKCKRNAVIGLRTSWSMDNDEAWALSQRYGGWIFMVSGAVTILCALTGDVKLATCAILAVLLLDVVLSVWASYIAYKKSRKKEE